MGTVTRRDLLHLGTSSVGVALAGALGGGGLALGVAGCAQGVRWNGVDVASGQHIDLAAGLMPTGGSFTGAYRSPHSGPLELIQDGDRIGGSYCHDEDGRRAVGTLGGKVTGNLAEFHWRERARAGELVTELHGRGFFLLDLSPLLPGGARLFGRRSFVVHGEAGTVTRDGGPWTAVRVA